MKDKLKNVVNDYNYSAPARKGISKEKKWDPFKGLSSKAIFSQGGGYRKKYE